MRTHNNPTPHQTFELFGKDLPMNMPTPAGAPVHHRLRHPHAHAPKPQMAGMMGHEEIIGATMHHTGKHGGHGFHPSHPMHVGAATMTHHGHRHGHHAGTKVSGKPCCAECAERDQVSGLTVGAMPAALTDWRVLVGGGLCLAGLAWLGYELLAKK
jgi:hypothetical protein